MLCKSQIMEIIDNNPVIQHFRILVIFIMMDKIHSQTNGALPESLQKKKLPKQPLSYHWGCRVVEFSAFVVS